MTPEGKVKEAIKRVLAEAGAYYYMPVQNGMGRTGIPDMIGCFNGQFFGIEVKAPGAKAKVTANQRRELQRIEAANGIAIVADCVQDVVDGLRLTKKGERHADQ